MAGTPLLCGKTVWIVDDDQTVLLLAEEVLTSEGFRVRTFAGARETLEAFAESLPDLLVLDVILPDMIGFELCSWLRRHPGGENVPVLIMTSLNDSESIHKAYEVGATGFVTKPINWTIEIQRLRYMLRSTDVARELRCTEQETRLAKEDWERTFDSITDIVTVLDLDLRILRANSAVAKALGKPLENILGEPCYRLFQGTNQSCADCPVVRSLTTGSPASSERNYSRLAGTWLVSASPVTDPDGQITRVVHVARDLSEQKQMEAELRQAQKLEAIGTLAGGIAHEFNNLLQIVLGSAELLASPKSNSQQEDWALQTIFDASKRGSALARQLLTFSRKKAGSGEKQPVSLNHLVQSIEKMLERMLPRTVAIQTRLTPGLKLIQGDSEQLQQLLVNLTVNASQAMREGGTITLETRNVRFEPEDCRQRPDLGPGDYVLLVVSDTGHGMDKLTKERIFDPFFTTKGVGKGTGLGLSVVFGIVKEHAGVIHCDSQPGVGTTFNIHLPAIVPTVYQAIEGPREAPIAIGSETIMVVDDEEMVRTMVSRFLTRAGYTVIPVPNGESALRRYREEKDHPKLVLLDLGMPGMGGWKCLEQLRGQDCRARILVASGYGGDDLENRLNRLGAAGFVMKPYRLKELAGIIRKLLDVPKS